MTFILPTRAKDLTGQRFGKLIALRPVGISKCRDLLWKCKCDCGREVTVRTTPLTHSHTRSCGCLQREMVSIAKKTHGMSHTSEYNVWQCMIQRCENPKYHHYGDYGGRGIKICERWHKFENFYEDMGKRPEGKTLDRMNNEGIYEPENCRWATYHEQNMNQRDHKNQKWFLGFNTNTGAFEENNNLSEFAREHNLTASLISHCLHHKLKRTKGWEFDYLPLC